MFKYKIQDNGVSYTPYLMLTTRTFLKENFTLLSLFHILIVAVKEMPSGKDVIPFLEDLNESGSCIVN